MVDDLVVRVDATPAETRLSTLLAELATPGDNGRRADGTAARRADGVLRALTYSNHERQLAAKLVGVAGAGGVAAWPAPAVRRLLADLGRPAVGPAIGLWRASGAATLADAAAAIVARGDALAIGELALGGREAMSELGLAPGPALGVLLDELLTAVIEDPAHNTRDGLLALARSRGQSD
jgi:hypothetical protein